MTPSRPRSRPAGTPTGGLAPGGSTEVGDVPCGYRCLADERLAGLVAPHAALAGPETERVAQLKGLLAEIQRSRANEARLSRLLDQSANEIYIFDAASLRFLQTNEGARRNLGYTAHELERLTPLDLKPEFTPESFAALVEPLRRGERDQLVFETVHRRKDGSRYPVEVHLQLAGSEQPPVFVAMILDITDRKRAEGERGRLVAALEQTADGVLIADPEGRILYVNSAFERASGYSRSELIGQNPRIFRSGRHSAGFDRAMWATLTRGEVWSGSRINKRKDGSLYEVEIVISPVRDADGRLTSYVETARDVTHERMIEAALEREIRQRAELATGLARLRAQPTPEETASAVCVAILRLPGYDAAEVIWFRAGGQAVTIAAEAPPGTPVAVHHPLPPSRGDYLRERASKGPWVETWLPGPEDGPYEPTLATAGLRAAAYAPLRGGSGVFGLLVAGTASPATADRLINDLPSIVAYAAIASALLAPALEARGRMTEGRDELRSIIRDRAFRPVFQPVVDLDGGAVVGYEALTRFSDGTPPDRQFAAAAAAGVGLELEAACIEEALKDSAELPASAWLSLNVSPQLLLAGEPLASLLRNRGRQVILELTEHVAINDYAALRAAILQLGPSVRLAVDDAGAGFASFRHILELHPDFVKLDMGLVRGIDRDPARQALVAGMRHFALRTGIALIAEGIESEAELTTLRSLEVQFGQGYLFGRAARATSDS